MEKKERSNDKESRAAMTHHCYPPVLHYSFYADSSLWVHLQHFPYQVITIWKQDTNNHLHVVSRLITVSNQERNKNKRFKLDTLKRWEGIGSEIDWQMNGILIRELLSGFDKFMDENARQKLQSIFYIGTVTLRPDGSLQLPLFSHVVMF